MTLFHKIKKNLFIFCLLLLYIDIYYINLFHTPQNINNKLIEIEHKKEYLVRTFNSNIYLKNDFFSLKEVKKQIYDKNLTKIITIFATYNKVGNALVILNNLINICVIIQCKNIIIPYALRTLIKKTISYKKHQIKILPYSYRNISKIDIILKAKTIFNFNFKNQTFKNRLYILREEIFHNIPKVDIQPNDLIIKIRSGDIFFNSIYRHYAQPPLCFYQKIIIENKFEKIIILSNGHENPVVNELLKIYPTITYIEGTVEEAISFIVNAFNMVYSVSTFQHFLIPFNKNLKNLYIYEIKSYNIREINFTVHKMKPSRKYLEVMKDKWNNSKEQLNLMINENCINDKIYTFSP